MSEAVPLPCLLVTTQPDDNCDCGSGLVNGAGKRLGGHVARRAHTVALNVRKMVKRHGLERVAFQTWTFKENLTDYHEAQKRFNSMATHYLRYRRYEYIACVERQGRGAIHYHLVLGLGANVRDGFDFAAATAAQASKRGGDARAFRYWERRYLASANAALRCVWKEVRDAAAAYGFGRCETLPILQGTEAVAYYVGAYVSSEWRNREERDKGMRTVRYSMGRSNDTCKWAFVGGEAGDYRAGCSVLAEARGLSHAESWLGRLRYNPLFLREVTSWGSLVRTAGKAVALEAVNSLPGRLHFDRISGGNPGAGEPESAVAERVKTSRSGEVKCESSLQGSWF